MSKKTIPKSDDGDHPAPNGQLKQKILRTIRERGEVTFAEVARLPRCSDPGYTLWWDRWEHCVVWRGISAEAREALVDLYSDDLIHVAVCEPSAYGRDRRTDMPVGEKRWYPDDHWLPMVLRAGPEPVA